MKLNRLAVALAIFISLGAQAAQQKTVPTLFTCEQDDGDQWIEVGIAMNDGPGLQMLVVAHNEDDHSARLIFSTPVMKRRLSAKSSMYVNRGDTAHLIVSMNNGGVPVQGSLSILKDGPGSINENRLMCYPRGSISFQTRR